ncbi:MAG: DUF882 domain-containing protein [Desulfobacterales bacterium]
MAEDNPAFGAFENIEPDKLVIAKTGCDGNMMPNRAARKLPSLLMVLIVAGSIMAAAPLRAVAESPKRFFYSGDGQIELVSQKNGRSFSGRYRNGAQGYDEAALAAIGRLFDVPADAPPSELSLRLLEYLDFLQDRFRKAAKITITSGYRSPEYNTGVRRRGGLAAKASLHQYGMAADIEMAGVPARRIWQTVKELKFGGAGYYHGDTVHIDVGPARSWDETTSGVGTGISDDNKLVGLVADFDRYRAGDVVTLRFIRMTAFPIGVAPEFALDRLDGAGGAEMAVSFRPSLKTASAACPQFEDIDQMASIQWRLPAALPAGRYAVRARFCGGEWEKMPPSVTTPAFEVLRP